MSLRDAFLASNALSTGMTTQLKIWLYWLCAVCDKIHDFGPLSSNKEIMDKVFNVKFVFGKTLFLFLAAACSSIVKVILYAGVPISAHGLCSSSIHNSMRTFSQPLLSIVRTRRRTRECSIQMHFR